MTYGFIGCGNMGGAVARAVCRAADPQNVVLANRTPAKAEALARELGYRTAEGYAALGSADAQGAWAFDLQVRLQRCVSETGIY